MVILILQSLELVDESGWFLRVISQKQDLFVLLCKVGCDTLHHSQIKTLFPVHPDHLLNCPTRQTRCDDFSNKPFSSPQLNVKIVHNIRTSIGNMFDGAGFLSRSTEIDIYQSRKCPMACCGNGCFGQDSTYHIQHYFFIVSSLISS